MLLRLGAPLVSHSVRPNKRYSPAVVDSSEATPVNEMFRFLFESNFDRISRRRSVSPLSIHAGGVNCCPAVGLAGRG